MAKPKRVLLIGDLHCGHRAGLTPPQYQTRGGPEHIWEKFLRVQRDMWQLYAAAVKRLRPIHCLIVNGDCIDGRGEKSGGVELLTGDRSEQCKMAVECIKLAEPKHIVMTRGTSYHVGEIESWEDIIADTLKTAGHIVKIGDHEWINVNGHVFDVKHHIGGSQVPHGRLTAPARDEIWNALWAEAGLQPRANRIIRSHVHYCVGGFRYVGGRRIDFMTLPALQAMGTRFGARRMSGTVDWGLVAFDINDKGQVVWEHFDIHTIAPTVAKATVV